MKLTIFSGIAATLVAVAMAAYAFTPFTFSPDVVDIQPGEECQKEAGRLKCRWDGQCAKVGNKCMSCIGGFNYSQEMGTCWSCGQGTSLTKENGNWVCK